MAKNKKSSVPEKNKSSKNVSNQSKEPEITGKKAIEKETGTEPANASNLQEANVSNEKNAIPDKSSEIKDVDPQNPVEESACEKDVETKKTPQENNQDQPLETEDESSSLAVPEDESHEAPPDTNCKCMQKKPGGKYFCFKLVQGRWTQSSAIPFDTKEFCEEICC